MQVIEKDITFPFDVDKTLIFWKPEGADHHPISMRLDYYGEEVSVYPHKEHIRLLKASLARGRNVVVWSGNGYAWAKTVLDALVARKYLENTEGILVMSKPAGYVDDADAATWIGSRVYIPPHSNPYAED